MVAYAKANRGEAECGAFGVQVAEMLMTAAYTKWNVISTAPIPEASAKIVSDISQAFAEVAKQAGIKPE